LERFITLDFNRKNNDSLARPASKKSFLEASRKEDGKHHEKFGKMQTERI
jgi:hypothetical protein